MSATQKPFACPLKGCGMTFTNEDHLNCHENKHGMVLNLGSANKNNDVADQTPTPTRFIRNCEEVGLFQDLQNNPFEEIFKKAVELSKIGTLHVPETTSDDTLHTPHIFPHVEEINKKKYTSDSHSDLNSDFTLSSVNLEPTVITINVDEETPIVIELDDRSLHARDTQEINSNNKRAASEGNVKEIIKEALKNKGQKRSINDSTAVVSVPILKEFELSHVKANNHKHKIVQNPIQLVDGNNEKEKVREMNRAAQLRCRKRKQLRISEMEQENMILRAENKKLCAENVILRTEVANLQELIIKYEYDSRTKQNVIAVSVTPPKEKISNSSSKSSLDHQKQPKNTSIYTKSDTIVHILTPSGKLPVTLLSDSKSSEFSSSSDSPPSLPPPIILQNPKPVKTKGFRKIVPKANK